MEGDALERLRASLALLALRPPPVLLLEGGGEAERMDLALYWAMSANCPQALARAQAGEPARPCMECPVCKQILALEHLDLRLYDGRISNRDDEEKPGPVRALRIENVRELIAAVSTRPHGAGKRVAIIMGMTQTREEALNSLLKTLEEPGDNTLFVLLTPQRQQILPTLVSRSFCMTLPWAGSAGGKSSAAQWEDDLARFLASGEGFLDALGAKGSIDAGQAAQLAVGLQRSLARVLGGRGAGALDKSLASLGPKGAAILSAWLTEAQDMLALNVSPARVLEALACRLYILLRSQKPALRSG